MVMIVNVMLFYLLTVACQCNRFGSVRSDCEQTTGRCVCRSHVIDWPLTSLAIPWRHWSAPHVISLSKSRHRLTTDVTGYPVTSLVSASRHQSVEVTSSTDHWRHWLSRDVTGQRLTSSVCRSHVIDWPLTSLAIPWRHWSADDVIRH